MSKIEEMIMTGVAPYPVERTMIVSGILEACLSSKVQANKILATPQLEGVRYKAPKTSQYARS